MVSLAPTPTSLTPAASITNNTPSKMPPPSSPATSILKPTKSAVHTTTTAGTKRKMMEMELGSSPSSPASDAGSRDGPAPRKRARVQFEPEVKTRHLPPTENRDENEKSTAVIREEVRRAIHRHVSGTDSEAYDRVKEIFTIDPKKVEEDGSMPYDMPSHTSIKRHLMGLLSNVAALDRSCSGLVHAVLGSEWLGRDDSYVRLFVRFLGNLSAAQGGYLRSVLKMLVNYLGEGKGHCFTSLQSRRVRLTGAALLQFLEARESFPAILLSVTPRSTPEPTWHSAM
jgi:RNA polymerase I-specific transcription initiation factor RRN3